MSEVLQKSKCSGSLYFANCYILLMKFLAFQGVYYAHIVVIGVGIKVALPCLIKDKADV